jgi:predicted nucleotidyltransferase
MVGPLDDRLRTYFREQQPAGLVSAYLFGSHAEDRAHRESDVDVGVLLDRAIFPREEDRFRVRVPLGSELIRVLHRNEVDDVILNDAPPLLGRGIVNKGRRVYCQGADLDKDFRRDVQIRAADLEPFLERMKRIKLETLRR